LAEFAKKIYQVKTKPSSLIITIAEESLGRNFYQALKAAVHASNVIKYKTHPKPALIFIGKMQDGIGTNVFKKEFETYMNMKPKEVMQDLRRRVEEGTFNETLQKINRLMMFVPRINFIVVSDKASKEVELLLKEKNILFFRNLDDALSTVDRNLLKDALIIPEGASTVPSSI
jgi:nickel-dependent lactate racemase